MNNLHAPEVGDQVGKVTRVELELPVKHLVTVSTRECCLWLSVSLIQTPKEMASFKPVQFHSMYGIKLFPGVEESERQGCM